MSAPRVRPLTDPAWADEALCRGMYDLFFSYEIRDKDAARKVCRRCPVIAPCLEDAIVHESWHEREHAGIRAALSPAQILTIRRNRNRRKPRQEYAP